MADSGVEPGSAVPGLVIGQVGDWLRALRQDLDKYEGCTIHIQVGDGEVQLDGRYAAIIYANVDDGPPFLAVFCVYRRVSTRVRCGVWFA